MHLHKWGQWAAKYPDADSIIQAFEEMLRRNHASPRSLKVKDIDERRCTKCGKRQQREVKP
jgi:hypothetical protein